MKRIGKIILNILLFMGCIIIGANLGVLASKLIVWAINSSTLIKCVDFFGKFIIF